MRIVQVAPDFVEVPPRRYGGIERVVANLTDELVNRGHEVFLFALPGSSTKANLVPYEHRGDAWRIASFVQRALPNHVDVIHDHTHGSVVGCSGLPTPVVCTIHVPWWNEVKHPVFLSRHMQNKIGMGRGYVVYNGINLDDFPFSENKADYMLFLGRLNEEKGILKAIEIAEAAQQRLVIAGPATDPTEPQKYRYYLNEVAPRLSSSSTVDYVGEVAARERGQLLQNAKCVLFPSDEEAFGLVVIEAMACGTPVLALGNGAIPEILKPFPGMIGFNTGELTNRIKCEGFPNPWTLREYVARYFSSTVMAANYERVYQDVVSH